MARQREGNRRMGILSVYNLRKTISYLKRNGLRETLITIREHLPQAPWRAYTYVPVPEPELERQRRRLWEEPVTFSIVVPAYHTPERFFRELIESVLSQTYPHWQLVIGDAGEGNTLEELAASYGDGRICCQRLSGNRSIADNTNETLQWAEGDYVALLDHDDVLTPDALYVMAEAIEEGRLGGKRPGMLYSDEDKCDGNAKRFYEPNIKPEFNLDLLLTNNYICHLLVMRTELIKELGLRAEYDGAQDHDLALRAAAALGCELGAIVHVPRVLYHWRCHSASTAANPESKLYAYEAGVRASQDYVDCQGWKARVSMTQHMGFSRTEYDPPVLEQRPELGAIGGRVLDKSRRIVGGMMDESGEVQYLGVKDGCSGYLNRAMLVQQAQALDLRCIRLGERCRDLFREVTGLEYEEAAATGMYDWRGLPEDYDCAGMGLKLSRALREAGYVLLWDPQLVCDLQEY
ncbi:MAG: glycosyltransferase [bacterium]|nr:glycosyltransferase [bacterium]MCM1376569.1 glycosyltransferase [Muribaculum sp.]